ncbi:MAG: hypothetical protein ISF22_00525 [Methanomassiliicoccus sp.]|nr:hypothetical protein [Methanomassiliicoccus sp.]
MGRRARFRGAKATPKTLEKDLLEKSKALAGEPSLLMPRCTKECRRCDFKKAVDKMEKVSQRRSDPKKLEKAMNRGDQLVRAYAATISLHQAGKVPYLAATKTPMGEVSYAVRGKAERDKLIGVQHYDDPELRLLALWGTAQKRGLHIYSTEKCAICSPDGPRPPAEYVREAVGLLPYDLDVQGACPHVKDGRGIRVRWKGADRTIAVCPSCAGDINTAHMLASRIAAKDPTDDFEVEVISGLKCDATCQGCHVKDAYQLPKDLVKRYLSAELNDTDLLEEHTRSRAAAVREKQDEVYMVGEVCYGRDKERFLAAMRGSDTEKKAISSLISSRKLCVLSRTDQAANLISDLWPEHKEELLAAVASPDIVKRVLAERSELTPSQMVAEAGRMESYREIEGTLPSFKALGPVGAHADRVAHLAKTEGKEAALRHIEKSKGSDHRQRSVSVAFLSALGEGQTKSWQFTREETDYGAYLAPFAQQLLASAGDDYVEALRLLLEASGSNEKAEKA